MNNIFVALISSVLVQSVLGAPIQGFTIWKRNVLPQADPNDECLIQMDAGLANYGGPKKRSYECSPKSYEEIEGVGRSCSPEYTRGDSWDCTSFCELERTFFYGEAIPYDGLGLHCDQKEAVLEQGKSVSVATTINAGVTLADPLGILSLQAGITVTKEHTTSETVRHTVEIPKPEDYCAQWVYVPSMVRSCGDLTKYGWYPHYGGKFGDINRFCVYENVPDIRSIVQNFNGNNRACFEFHHPTVKGLDTIRLIQKRSQGEDAPNEFQTDVYLWSKGREKLRELIRKPNPEPIELDDPFPRIDVIRQPHRTNRTTPLFPGGRDPSGIFPPARSARGG